MRRIVFWIIIAWVAILVWIYFLSKIVPSGL
jgi:hypothetical protein